MTGSELVIDGGRTAQ